MKKRHRILSFCISLFLPLAASAGDKNGFDVTIKIERIEQASPIEIEQTKRGRIQVLGMVERSGATFPYTFEMTVLDAVKKAGGLKEHKIKGKLGGKQVAIVSPSRGYRLLYNGPSASSSTEEWIELYGTILIAKGDTIYISGRVF